MQSFCTCGDDIRTKDARCIDCYLVLERQLEEARRERDALQKRLDWLEQTQRTYYDVEARAGKAERERDDVIAKLKRLTQGHA